MYIAKANVYFQPRHFNYIVSFIVVGGNTIGGSVERHERKNGSEGSFEPISPFISLAVRQVRNYPAHGAVLASVIPVCNNIGMIQIFIPSR